MKDVRDEYQAEQLDEKHLDPDPLKQAALWVQQAINAELPLPNAMTLATTSAQGQPSCRTVLLKGIEQGGFVFFSHYDSHKGMEISENSSVAAVLFWQPFSRQITFTGHAEPVSAAESDAYFASRPRGSQISAAISPQSRPASREWLEQQRQNMENTLNGQPVPRPDNWGGYRIMPTEIQFWHGRPDRLHDRFRYLLQAEGEWLIERLAP